MLSLHNVATILTGSRESRTTGQRQNRLPLPFNIKGSVQRKLRWVENGANRSVGASDCGAGRSFVVLFGFHLGFAIFPYPVSNAQIIGEFWINR
jgi:hypothetical protein